MVKVGEAMIQSSVGPLDEQLEKFDEVPSTEGIYSRYLLGGFMGFAFLCGLSFFLLNEWLGPLKGTTKFVAVLSTGFVWLLVLRRYWSWASLASMQMIKGKDGNLPQPAEGYYLGVAYCNGIWSYRGDTSWDRGYLTIEESGLRFAGHTSSFQLPYARIIDLRIHHGKTIVHTDVPRLFIDWLDWRGNVNTLSLEVRIGVEFAAIKEQTYELANQIHHAWQKGKESDYRKDVDLPFLSTDLDFSVAPEETPILPRERNLALLWSAALIVAGFATSTWLEPLTKLKGNFVGLFLILIGLKLYPLIIWSMVRNRKASGTGSTGAVSTSQA